MEKADPLLLKALVRNGTMEAMPRNGPARLVACPMDQGVHGFNWARSMAKSAPKQSEWLMERQSAWLTENR
jgi:hypothetical protein